MIQEETIHVEDPFDSIGLLAQIRARGRGTQVQTLPSNVKIRFLPVDDTFFRFDKLKKAFTSTKKDDKIDPSTK